MPSRTRRPATYARLGATGLSVAGTVGLIAAMSSAASAKAESTPDPSVLTPSATDAVTAVDDASVNDDPADDVVVIELHRTVYVDERGREIDPNSVVSLPSSQVSSPESSVAVPSSSVVSRPRPRRTGSTVTSTTSSSTPTTVPPSTAPPPPRCSGSGC